MATPLERMNDEDYKNWLKVGQSLLLMCEGVHNMTTEVIDKFHNELLSNLGQQTCISPCKAKARPSTQKNCMCTVCPRWEKDILDQHASKGGVHWTNIDCKKWPSLAWEVAKVYMPRGQKPHVAKAADTDSSALLNLIMNCKKFRNHVGKAPANKVIEVRNQTMHSTKMKFETTEMTQHIAKILNLLRDQQELCNRPEAKKAAKTVEEIRDGKFVITAHEEEKILKDRFEQLERRIENMEDKITPELTEAIRNFQDFINGNVDLKSKFGEDLETLQNRVDMMEKKLDGVIEKVDDLDDKISQLSARPPPDPLPTMFKNHLNEYAQTEKLAKLPEYQSIAEEKGFRSQVTVNGKTYRSKDVRTTKKDAEQDAAREALRMLGKLPPEEPSTDDGVAIDGGDGGHLPPRAIAACAAAPVVEDDGAGQNRQQHSDSSKPSPLPTVFKNWLNEYAHIEKLVEMPVYDSNKAENNGFHSQVTVNGKTYRSKDVRATKKDAEQDAAREALRMLGKLPLEEPSADAGTTGGTGGQARPIAAVAACAAPAAVDDALNSPEQKRHKCMDDDFNYKGALQTYLQKMQHPPPTYRNNKINDTPPTFTAWVTVKLGEKSKEYASESSQSSAKKAEQNAAKIAMIRLDIPLPEGTVKVQDSSPKKPETSPGKVDKPVAASPESGQGDKNFRKELEMFLQKQKILGSEIKYDETKVGEQLFMSKVVFKTKYAIQTKDTFNGKKEAEESLAKQILQELGKDATGNYKSKLNELDPPNFPKYITKVVDSAAANKQYCSVILFSKIDTKHEIVVEGAVCNSKKLAKESAAQNAMDLFKDFKF